MSRPAWVNVGPQDSVGTATVAASTNALTIVGHGLDDGDIVMVDSLTGGADGPLIEGAVYFVRNTTADTFQLSGTRGSQLKEFGSDGGADVYVAVPSYPAADLRRLDSALMYPTGDGLGARSGVRPHSQAVVTVSGTTWTVHPHSGVVYPGLTSTAGPYRYHQLSDSGGLDPADGSNPRLDAVDLLVEDDDEDASGFRRSRPVYTAGTPASSPSAPALDGSALRLATILVPTGGSPAPSVQALGPFTVGAGGVLPVRDADDLPSGGLYDGMMAWLMDRAELVTRLGSLWIPPALGWCHIASGTADDVTSFTVDLTDGGRFPAGTFQQIRLHVKGRTTGLVNVTVRMNGDATTDLHQSSFITWDSSDAGAVVTTETDSGLEGTTARLARWSTSLRMNHIEAVWRDVDAASRCSYVAEGVRQATNAGNFGMLTTAWGSLNEDRLLSSLQIRTAALAEDFSLTKWWVEGYRA